MRPSLSPLFADCPPWFAALSAVVVAAALAYLIAKLASRLAAAALIRNIVGAADDGAASLAVTAPAGWSGSWCSCSLGLVLVFPALELVGLMTTRPAPRDHRRLVLRVGRAHRRGAAGQLPRPPDYADRHRPLRATDRVDGRRRCARARAPGADARDADPEHRRLAGLDHRAADDPARAEPRHHADTHRRRHRRPGRRLRRASRW